MNLSNKKKHIPVVIFLSFCVSIASCTERKSWGDAAVFTPFVVTQSKNGQNAQNLKGLYSTKLFVKYQQK